MGWAQPKLTADYLGSLPGFSGLKSSNGLRADETPTAYSVKPDSIILNLGGSLGNVKATFGEYQTVDLSLIANMVMGRGLTIDMPQTITVTSAALPLIPLAQISLDYTTSEDTLINVEASMSLAGAPATDLVGVAVYQDETTAYNVGVEIGGGLQTLLSLPPVDYLIKADLLRGLLGNGVVSASLYGIPQAVPNSQIPMGDAEIGGMTLSALMGGGIPQYINVTSYETEVPYNANGWTKLWLDLNQTEENVVLTIDNSSWTENEGVWEDSTHVSLTTVTMTEYVNATNAQAAVQSVVNRAVTELATTGAASRYEMEIETTAGGVTLRVMDVTVTPSIEGINAVATINIQPYENGAASTPFDIVATADLAGSNVIAVDVVMGETTVGSAYFTSNIAGIVTDNEDIQLANVEVTPVKDGIYVSGTTAASYRIVSMSGAIVANGTVSGDNAYISTSALAKGIYVIVVTENGESKAIKFAR